MFSLTPGMPQNANLFPSQQAPRFQLATNQVTSPAGTTSPLHPGLQLIPETIQRQIMQQNAALLFASNNAFLQQHQLQQQSNSLPPGGFINLASMRTGQQQKSPSLGGVAPGLPQLHHVGGSTGPGNLGKSGQVTPPMLSNFQLPNRASQPNNKVRAPISHIPSTTQRSLPQLSSLGQAQSIPGLNQSVYHHGKQVNTPSSATQRFPSQVTWYQRCVMWFIAWHTACVMNPGHVALCLVYLYIHVPLFCLWMLGFTFYHLVTLLSQYEFVT